MINCWERDNPDPKLRCVTCGESEEGPDGVRISLETTLTAPADTMLDNCFDYCFEMRKKGSQGSKPPFTLSETKIEHMSVKKGSKSVWDGQAREYT